MKKNNYLEVSVYSSLNLYNKNEQKMTKRALILFLWFSYHFHQPSTYVRSNAWMLQRTFPSMEISRLLQATNLQRAFPSTYRYPEGRYIYSHPLFIRRLKFWFSDIWKLNVWWCPGLVKRLTPSADTHNTPFVQAPSSSSFNAFFDSLHPHYKTKKYQRKNNPSSNELDRHCPKHGRAIFHATKPCGESEETGKNSFL